MDRELTTTEIPRPLVTTEEGSQSQERVLLRPRTDVQGRALSTPARTGESFQYLGSAEDIEPALVQARKSKYVAVDFETRGNDPSDPNLGIFGIGLAWDTGSIYFHWVDLSEVQHLVLRDFIFSHPGILAHNAYFDAGVLRQRFGTIPKFHACTLATYMMLSNEGWAGQQWGLKLAQKEILLWTETNEKDLDQWLVLNGYYKGTKRKDGSREALQLGWEQGLIAPDKGEMWRAPREILGKYCVLDAESCYLLFTEHLLPVLEQFPEFHTEFLPQFMHLIEMHIEQKMHGLLMDREALLSRDQELQEEIGTRVLALRQHPQLSPHILDIEAGLLAALKEKEPVMHLLLKPRPAEPPQFNLSGAESKNWRKWVEQEERYTVPVLSKNWINWNIKWNKAIRGEDPAYQFNLNSDPQVIDLLYTRLQQPVKQTSEKTGSPSTSIKAIKQMGSLGAPFIDLLYAQKEVGFTQDYLKRTETRPTIHPSFRLPGTKTGRLSSKAPNLQQVPKSKAMMSLFRAHPGYILVDLDFSALEPVVATEFSKDPNMLQIYGDGKLNNDVYLFVGAHIPGMGPKIRGAGYDPYNPTREGLASAKKTCKSERSICKTVVLACQYGAGVNRIIETLENDDIFLPREEVEKIHAGYWNLFPEVKQFGRDLQRQWKRNGGYVLNGMGRPMCLTEDYKHDVLNRFIQSTGHDILVKYVFLLTKELDRRGLDWKPWVIDWHDATAVEVREDQLEETVEVYLDSLTELNRQLNGTITLKGVPSWGSTMADIKEPEA